MAWGRYNWAAESDRILLAGQAVRKFVVDVVHNPAVVPARNLAGQDSGPHSSEKEGGHSLAEAAARSSPAAEVGYSSHAEEFVRSLPAEGATAVDRRRLEYRKVQVLAHYSFAVQRDRRWLRPWYHNRSRWTLEASSQASHC